MAPPKWDDEEDSTPPSSPPLVAARRKFDDEEEEEVLDSWDAAEDSEVEREKAKAAAAAKAKADAEAAAKKKSKVKRIEEHQVERRRRAEDDSDSSEDEDEAERRARLRQTEQDADLKHAQDLIGDIDLNRSKNRGKAKAVVIGDASDPTKAIDLSALPLFKPTTKDQFANLTSILIPLLTANSKKAQYALWAPEFCKQLVKELPSDQIKKVASSLTALSNEKMREERAADKGGKKSKAAKSKTTLNTQRDFTKVDTNTYEEEDFGDEDFM